MKRFINIIFAALILLLLINSQDVQSAKDTPFEKGKRFLKLGNSYRENGDFQNASKYLSRGKALVLKQYNSSWEGKYWSAVAYEYYGYLFRDMGIRDNSAEWIAEAKNNMKKALEIYKRIIDMKEGSPVPVDDLVSDMENLKAQLDQFGVIKGLDKKPTNVRNHDNSKLRELPEDIPEDVVNLSLANNRFRYIPYGIFDLKKLKYLNLSGNKIRRMDCCIDELKNLHWLDLSNNKMREISPRIGRLDNLAELNLANNKFRELPKEICSLKNLKVLDLTGNDNLEEKIEELKNCLPNTSVLFSKSKD